MANYSLVLSVDSENVEDIINLAKRLTDDTVTGSALLFGMLHNASLHSTGEYGHAVAAEQEPEVSADKQTDKASNEPAPEAQQEPASAAPPAPSFTNFGVNVYESDDHAFALGKKIYGNGREAAYKKTQNGNWLASFDFGIDLNTGSVRGIAVAASDGRFFAVHRDGYNGIKFSKGYDSASAAAANNEDALAVVSISLDDDNNVFISA